MEGIIVYRRRRPTKISPSLSASDNPKKRHGCSEDSSVVWFNLGKTEPVKEYRCNELDEYTRKADSSQDFHTMEGLKHGQHENAMISDCRFEAQEQDEVEEITTGRAKRTRCLYSPENENSLENSVFHPESLEFRPFSSKEDNSSLKPGLAAERTSSKSVECDSSAPNLDGANSDQVSESSGVVKRKKLNLKGELKTHNDQQSFNVDIKDQKETGAYLDIEVEKLPQSALVDVDLTVRASYQAKNVQFVCLTSEACGTVILGYPLEIGEITDGSETLLPSKESVARMLLGDNGSRFHQLVWRTSKRTPVCYVTDSLSPSISKNVQAKQACENVEDSILPARENGVLTKEKSLAQLLKNPKQINVSKTALSQSCVPVELIFSKMLAAVYQVQT